MGWRGPNVWPHECLIQSFSGREETGQQTACLLFPSRAKKRKESSKTTTSMASVLFPPYPFWELVVTWSYRSTRSVTHRVLELFQSKACHKDLSFPDWTLGWGLQSFYRYYSGIFIYFSPHSIEHVTPHNCFYILLDLKIVSNLLAPKSFLFFGSQNKGQVGFYKVPECSS